MARKSKVFKPIRKKNATSEAFAEKIDIENHKLGLKKTNSKFLEESKHDHQRSVTTRGEEIFGIKPVNSNELSAAQVK